MGGASNWSRVSRHERGYGTAWDKIRKHILYRDHGLCVPCQAQGKLTQATEVDHIVDKASKGTDDPSNLQSICNECHKAKTAAAQGRTLKPKVTIGMDGWTVG